ncbi:unnamed protein product [Pedinophyceae sp. YPF-701]|nr:unnamed protein product [Pedinophyceae sp. YPF-701]
MTRRAADAPSADGALFPCILSDYESPLLHRLLPGHPGSGTASAASHGEPGPRAASNGAVQDAPRDQSAVTNAQSTKVVHSKSAEEDGDVASPQTPRTGHGAAGTAPHSVLDQNGSHSHASSANGASHAVQAAHTGDASLRGSTPVELPWHTARCGVLDVPIVPQKFRADDTYGLEAHRDAHAECAAKISFLMDLGLAGGSRVQLKSANSSEKYATIWCIDEPEDADDEDDELRDAVLVSPILAADLGIPHAPEQLLDRKPPADSRPFTPATHAIQIRAAPVVDATCTRRRAAAGAANGAPAEQLRASPGPDGAPEDNTPPRLAGLTRAASVTLAKVKEPIVSMFLTQDQDAVEEERYARAREAGLRDRFRAPRALAIGDVVPVFFRKPPSPFSGAPGRRRDEAAGATDGAEGDAPLAAAAWQDVALERGWQFACFRVTRIEPETSKGADRASMMRAVFGGAPCVVVPRETKLVVAGQVQAILPPGLRGYCGAELWGRAGKARRPHDWTAPPKGWHRTLSELHPRTPLLGWLASGPRAATPWLPGVGPLAPTWRALAEILAPIYHPDTAIGLTASILLTGPPGSGKDVALRAVAHALGLNIIPLECQSLADSSPSETELAEFIKQHVQESRGFPPCLVVFRNVGALAQPLPGDHAHNPATAQHADATGRGPPHVMAQLRRAVSECGRFARPQDRVVIAATAEMASDVPAPLRAIFTHHHRCEPLPGGGGGRASVLGPPLASVGFKPSPEAWDVLQKGSAGLSLRDLSALTAGLALAPARGGEGAERTVDAGEADVAATRVRGALRRGFGGVEVPEVRWADIGGLDDALAIVRKALKPPHASAGGRRIRPRSGVLLFGPPGTGKTLTAKAIATESGMNFLSVKGPELLDMYIGESERKVREVFSRALQAAPCVLFFDELDSLAPRRGAGGDSAGVMDRVVSQLLAEMDSVHQADASGGTGINVVVIGASNRPDLLDPALTRPGRLDTSVYVSLPRGVAGRAQVLRALTRKFAFAEDVDFEAVAALASERASGADLYGACADAWMRAARRRIKESQAEGGGELVGPVAVTQEDMMGAVAVMAPSVSAEELERYEAIAREHAGPLAV